jgi:hypothetical protein
MNYYTKRRGCETVNEDNCHTVPARNLHVLSSYETNHVVSQPEAPSFKPAHVAASHQLFCQPVDYTVEKYLKKLETSDSKFSVETMHDFAAPMNVVGCCQQIKTAVELYNKCASSEAQSVLHPAVNSGNLACVEQPASVIRSTGQSDGNEFRRPVSIPLKARATGASCSAHSSSASAVRKSICIVQSPVSCRVQSSTQAFRCAVTSTASSLMSESDRRLISYAKQQKSKALPVCEKSDARRLTSTSDRSTRFNNMQPFNVLIEPGASSIKKVASWLASTSEHYRPDENNNEPVYMKSNEPGMSNFDLGNVTALEVFMYICLTCIFFF